MALVRCRECGREVSSAAKTCPGCGVKSPAPTNWKGALTLLGIMFLIVGGMELFPKDKTPPEEPASNSPPETVVKSGPVMQKPDANGQYIVNGDRFGCKNREYAKKILDYAFEKDDEAFSNAFSAGILSGECTIFKAGEPVFETDNDPDFPSSVVRLRRKGKTEEYWVPIDAVMQ